MEFNFDIQMQGIERLANDAQRQLAETRTFDGRPMFKPEDMKQITDRALNPLREAVAQADAMAGRAEAYADTLDAGAYADTLGTVGNETLQRMGLLAPFIREEIEGMHLEGLADRLRGVVAHGDEATKRLYLRYARVDRSKPGGDRVAALLEQLDEALNGTERAKWAKETERAKGLRTKAANFRHSAYQRLAALDGTEEQRNAERRAAYRPM